MDVGVLILKIVAVLVLVFVNGFFVAAEFGLVKIRDTQLQTLIVRGHRRAKVARWVINNLDTSLSAAQLGITIASLLLGWIGEPVFADLLRPFYDWFHIDSKSAQHWISFIVGITSITFLHIVVGEQAPKWLAIQKPMPVALWVSEPLLWFRRVAYPFIWILNRSSLWVLARLGIEPTADHELVHSEDELRLLFATAQKHRGGTKLGRDIVLNALDLRRRVARSVMRPRQEIVFFSADATIAECIDIAEKTRFSRFPVCEEGNPDRMLGVIHIKDLYAMRLKTRVARELAPALRKVIYIPETAHLEKILQWLLDRKLHIAVVVDEYGGTIGLLTLENILEEIVGPIQDEFDQEKPLLSKITDNEWQLDGLLPLHELAELTGQEIPGDGIATTSGWVTHKLGGFPKPGDTLTLGGYELRVEEMEGLRVARLKLTRRAEAEKTQES